LGATINVNSQADVIAGDGQCTLREAVIAANSDTASGGGAPGECRAGGSIDTIEVPAGSYTRTTSGSGEDAGATGDLDVVDNVTIHGAGAATTTIDAARKDRVIDVAAGPAVRIEGVTITGGSAPPGSTGAPGVFAGEGGDGGDGGGIRNKGTLTAVACFVTDNLAGPGGTGGAATGAAGTFMSQSGGPAFSGQGGHGGRGGGIFSSGELTLTGTRITLNGGGQGGTSGNGTGGVAYHGTGSNGSPGGDGSSLGGGRGGGGGGLFSSGSGHVTVADSTVSGNAAGRGGTGGVGTGGAGGPNNAGTALGGTGGSGGSSGGGTGGEGGGISVEGPLTLSTSTISGNTSGRGGDGGGGQGGNGNTGNTTLSGTGGNGGPGAGGGGGDGGRAGGVAHDGSLSVVNVTVTGNRAGGAATGGNGVGGVGGSGVPGGNGGTGGAGTGGIGGTGGGGGGIAGATLTLLHGTVTANTAGLGATGGTGTGGGPGPPGSGGSPGNGGGGTGGATGSSGQGGGLADPDQATIASSILAGNLPDNCVGAFGDGGFNLDFPDSACPGAAEDPQVAALADNGGPTMTQAIAATSPAHDRTPSGPACAATDQRGVARPYGAACDTGAFELGPPAPPAPPAGGGPPGGGTDALAPLFSLTSLTNKVFAVDPNGTGEVSVAASKPKRGTTFRYTLTEASRVVFTIERRTRGRKVGTKCRKQTRKNRNRRACARYVRAGRFAAQGAAGPNSHKFSGRIGGKSLKPGRYRARLVATDAAGNKSAPKLLAFKVVRRR
jgi:CSLREA domain-containing protein